MTLINSTQQWFKSVAGWTVSEIPRENSLCTWTIQSGQPTVIADTQADDRTAEHPLVLGSPRFRFYAGVPLLDADQSIIGTFCVFDIKPRNLTAAEIQSLTDLAALAQNEFFADHLSNAHSALTGKLSIARREAMMDPLTRLWNRRGAMVMLKGAFEEGDKADSPMAIALLDLDNFKRVNDSYGHQVGDEVLRRLSSRLVSSVRGVDVTCRIGGDEFMLLMVDTDAGMAAKICERVRKSITETAIPTRQGNMPMSISVGFTVRMPHESISLDQLIERADRGLMQSKTDGRNLVRTAS